MKKFKKAAALIIVIAWGILLWHDGLRTAE